jgi:Fe-Mn family superoxide dismutase
MIQLPKLKYQFSDLEPYMDAKTVEIHYTKHHQTYLDNLNRIIEKEPSLQSRELEEILKNISSVKEDVRQGVINNGGGVFNHNIFWEALTLNSKYDPQSNIAKEIEKKFGSFENFKEEFTNKALGRFGSGYGWLVKSGSEIEIIETLNQDSPISVGKMPLLCVDVWEHAYYLKYQNRRAEYIENWWNIVDWEVVENRFNG